MNGPGRREWSRPCDLFGGFSFAADKAVNALFHLFVFQLLEITLSSQCIVPEILASIDIIEGLKACINGIEGAGISPSTDRFAKMSCGRPRVGIHFARIPTPTKIENSLSCLYAVSAYSGKTI